MRKESSILSRWGEWAGTHPGRVFLVALVITAVMTIGVTMLKMEMTFYSIMPESSPQVADLKAITDEFPFSSSIVVVVDGRAIDGPQAKQTVIQTIDDLASTFQSDTFSEWVDGVYGTVDVSYLRDHGLMLSKPKDLERLKTMYKDPNLVPFLRGLNDDLEREYSGDSSALENDENQVVAWVNGLEGILTELADSADGSVPQTAAINGSLDDFLIGDPYYLSRDENMGLLFLRPTYTINDLGPLVDGTESIDATVKDITAQHGITGGITGLIVVGKDEMRTSEQGFAASMLVAFILILLLLIVVFRMRSTPIVIGIPLALGIYWTVGLSGFIVQRLNIMTAMYMVALVGLGVDYAIHMMTGFVQERDAGHGYAKALSETFRKSGRGIITGALTTGAAFIVLLVAKSEMVKELAVVASVGILCELVAMIMLVPALLGARARRYEKKGKPDPMMKKKTKRVRSDFAGKLGTAVMNHPGLFLAALAFVGIGLSIWSPGISVEDNLMKMEAKGLESVKLEDVMVNEFGAAPDVLYYRSTDPNEIPPLVSKLEDLATVKYVDAVTQWVPTQSQQAERRPYLEDIRTELAGFQPAASVDANALLDELYRLESNLIEMGDLATLGGTDHVAFALNRVTGLDKDGKKVAQSVFDRLFSILESGSANPADLEQFQAGFSPDLAGKVRTMANPAPVTLSDAPDMVRNTFMSKDGKTSLVTISPRQNPWVRQNREAFTAQVFSVTDKATGMILAADQMTQIAERDGLRAMVAALAVVFLILLADFRNLKLTLLSFLPLGLSFGSLIGVMVLTGIKFDFVNIIAIPLLVGIGIDDTVHINHRYLLEGDGQMRATLAGTGTAVLMTTLTTMLGFASFIPSVMTAMRSTGIVLTLAMGLAFTFSILFHPSVLIIVREKWGWNLLPWGSKSTTTTKEES